MDLLKQDFQKFLRYRLLTKTMTNRPDICLQGAIIEHLRPLFILEYGPYLGGWCLFVNEVLKSNVTIYGVENFYTHQWGNNSTDVTLPSSSAELEHHIKNISAKLFNSTIDINIIGQAGSKFVSNELKFDLIRIDCASYDFNEHYNMINNSLKMLNNNGILIIEDVTPMHFAKLHSLFEAVYQGKIFPVVYGTECIICAADLASQEILFKKIEFLKNLLGLTVSRIRKKHIWYVGSVITMNETVVDFDNSAV